MRKSISTAAALIMGGAIAIAVASPAQADDEPTIRELLEKCGEDTDVCEFHPSGTPEFVQNTSEAVGSPVFNCTDRDQTSSVSWSETVSESNSVNLSMTATFGEIFKQSFSVSYGYEWGESHTESQTTEVTARPGEVAQVFYGPAMQIVEGTYEMHFEDAYKGHYVWYVPFEATGPAEDQGNTVTQSTRDMTDEEREEFC